MRSRSARAVAEPPRPRGRIVHATAIPLRPTWNACNSAPPKRRYPPACSRPAGPVWQTPDPPRSPGNARACAGSIPGSPPLAAYSDKLRVQAWSGLPRVGFSEADRPCRRRGPVRDRPGIARAARRQRRMRRLERHRRNGGIEGHPAHHGPESTGGTTLWQGKNFFFFSPCDQACASSAKTAAPQPQGNSFDHALDWLRKLSTVA